MGRKLMELLSGVAVGAVLGVVYAYVKSLPQYTNAMVWHAVCIGFYPYALILLVLALLPKLGNRMMRLDGIMFGLLLMPLAQQIDHYGINDMITSFLLLNQRPEAWVEFPNLGVLALLLIWNRLVLQATRRLPWHADCRENKDA